MKENFDSLFDPAIIRDTIAFYETRDRWQEILNYRKLTAETGHVDNLFYGDSITDIWPLHEFFPNHSLLNRGIGGDNTFGMIDRLPDILKSKPRKIFLMAGINDLTGGQPVDTIVMNITRMADMVHEAVPGCRLYIQSVLPVNTRRLAYPGLKGHNPQVRALNARLVRLCDAKPWCTFVDLAPLLSDADGELRIDLTKDGIHLHPAGYVIWTDYLKKQKYLK